MKTLADYAEEQREQLDKLDNLAGGSFAELQERVEADSFEAIAERLEMKPRKTYTRYV